MARAISTHAPRTGSDPRAGDERGGGMAFQPTLPARGATLHAGGRRAGHGDFNPRSPHGERPRVRDAPTRAVVISTHAPRTGSDKEEAKMKTCTIDISTHAPRTGSDFTPTANARKFEQFQPTLPARGATIPIHFLLTFKAISTHAPRTGSDACSLAVRSS